MKTFVRQRARGLRSFSTTGRPTDAAFGEASQALMNNQRLQLNAPSSCHCISGYCLITRYQPKKALRTICGKFVLSVCLSVLITLSAYEQRLDYELSVIHKMGFDDYFLIIWDVMDFAHQQEIVTELDGDRLPSIGGVCFINHRRGSHQI